jgi:hypothetical protein
MSIEYYECLGSDQGWLDSASTCRCRRESRLDQTQKLAKERTVRMSSQKVRGRAGRNSMTQTLEQAHSLTRRSQTHHMQSRGTQDFVNRLFVLDYHVESSQFPSRSAMQPSIAHNPRMSVPQLESTRALPYAISSPPLHPSET